MHSASPSLAILLAMAFTLTTAQKPPPKDAIPPSYPPGCDKLQYTLQTRTVTKVYGDEKVQVCRTIGDPCKDEFDCAKVKNRCPPGTERYSSTCVDNICRMPGQDIAGQPCDCLRGCIPRDFREDAFRAFKCDEGVCVHVDP